MDKAIPAPSVNRERLTRLVAAIGGILAGRGVPERSFGHHSIDALPLDASDFIIGFRPCLPKCFEDTCSFPLLKAIVDGGTGSQLPWQVSVGEINNLIKKEDVF